MNFLLKLFFRFDIEFNRLNHIFRFKNSVEVFFAKDIMFENKVVNTFTGSHSLFSYFSRIFITDDRVKSSNDTDRVAHLVNTIFLISFDTIDAEGT